MPELPEMEAWRRQLDEPVERLPDREGRNGARRDAQDVRSAASILEGRRLAGARRRAKRLHVPDRGRELVLLVHLMTAGRLRYLRAGNKGPKVPAFRLEVPGRRAARAHGGGIQEARRRLAPHTGGGRSGRGTLGPEALGLGAEALGGDLRLGVAPAPFAAARPARDRRDRAGLGERGPAPRAPVPLRPVQGPGPGAGAAALRRDRRGARARSRAARARGERREDLPRARQAPRALLRLRTPIARVDYEEHTVYYCPDCQTGGRMLKDRRLSRLLR